MKKEEKKELRDGINKSAAPYLSDQDEGDLYDAYFLLKEIQSIGNGDDIADFHVKVWQQLQNMTVNEILALIEAGYGEDDNIECTPEFIKTMDWELLRKQKDTLIKFTWDDKHKRFNEDEIEDMTGIINMIDAIQDYAMNECGIDEDTVFPLIDGNFTLDEDEE
jgi:hypothetical protein